MEMELDPIPYNNPPVEGNEGVLEKAWFRWLEDLVGEVVKSTRVVGSYESATTVAASISPTDLGVSVGGVYDVGWHLRITRAGTTSSIQVYANYVIDGFSVSQHGPAETGNTTTTVQGGIIRVLSDQNSPITFSTVYASTGGTAMQYEISVQCTKVS